MTTHPPDWTDALCRQVDGDTRFPENGEIAQPARAICQRCPLRRPCLQYAIDTNQHFGVWGGLTTSERHRVRRAAA